mgnify:FL=1
MTSGMFKIPQSPGLLTPSETKYRNFFGENKESAQYSVRYIIHRVFDVLIDG